VLLTAAFQTLGPRLANAGRAITVRSSVRDVHTRAKRTSPGWPLTVRRARTPLRRRSRSKVAAGEDGGVERARRAFHGHGCEFTIGSLAGLKQCLVSEAAAKP
jgi:hypothetical protein